MGTWEQEVPEGGLPVVLEGVVPGGGRAQVVELHELIGGGFDEEGADQLQAIHLLNKLYRYFIS